MKQKNKIFDFVFEWLECEEAFIFWMVILNITASWVTYGVFFRDFHSFITEAMILGNDIAISFLSVSIIDIILYLALRKFRTLHNAAKSIFVAVNVVMFCADIFTLYYFNIPLNNIMFEFIMMTNVRESTEFLQTYLLNLKFWGFAGMIIAAAVLFRLLWLKISTQRQNLRFAVFVLSFLVSILAMGRMVCIYDHNVFIPRTLNSVGISRLSSLFYTNRMNLKNYNKMLNETPKSVSITKDESTIPYIVYVLGESTNRNHMSLYGYNLDTNPLLSARSSNKNNLGGGYTLRI